MRFREQVERLRLTAAVLHLAMQPARLIERRERCIELASLDERRSDVVLGGGLVAPAANAPLQRQRLFVKRQRPCVVAAPREQRTDRVEALTLTQPIAAA